MALIYQKKMIGQIKEKSERDQTIIATMMYGSFTQNSGDQYSDIEFYIFIKDDEFESFISSEWIADIEPYYLHFKNEFGSEVAIFKNLIRGEFHFLSEKEMGIIDTFKYVGYFPDTDSMLIYDSTGELKTHLDTLKNLGVNRATDETIEDLWNNLLNMLLMGMNTLKRGELARALEVLWYIQRYLLQLIRIHEITTDRWVNPTKNLEQDIEADTYRKYIQCTARLSGEELYGAYHHALKLAKDLLQQLSESHAVNLHEELLVELEHYFDM